MAKKKPKLPADERAMFMRIRDIHPLNWSPEDVATLRVMLDRLYPLTLQSK